MSLPVLQRRIVGYFRRHPNACDDAEGVARWRLLDEVVRLGLRETQRALDALVERRILARRTVPGAAPMYCLIAPEPTAPAPRVAKRAAKPRSRRHAAGRGRGRPRPEVP